MEDTEFADNIHQALATAVNKNEPDRYVTRSIVIYESLGGDGARSLSCIASNDVRTWDVLGMIEFARQAAQQQVWSEGVCEHDE